MNCSALTLCRLHGKRDLRRVALLAHLVNPGLPGEPFVAGFADRTKGAPEEHRASAEAFSIRFHAGRNGASALGAFDHDHAHVMPPWISLAFGTAPPSAGVRSSDGSAAPADAAAAEV